MTPFEIAREKYKPEIIRYLLIAETPPKSTYNRFFYFENVDKQDSLFIETIKVLYPNEIKNFTTPEIRKVKGMFLEKFKNDGFYLIDSLDIPFEERYSPSQKVNLLKLGQVDLLKKIKALVNSKTEIILISATVYSANYFFLKQNGVNLLNSESIDFPGFGGQKKFRYKMGKIIK